MKGKKIWIPIGLALLDFILSFHNIHSLLCLGYLTAEAVYRWKHPL